MKGTGSWQRTRCPYSAEQFECNASLGILWMHSATISSSTGFNKSMMYLDCYHCSPTSVLRSMSKHLVAGRFYRRLCSKLSQFATAFAGNLCISTKPLLFVFRDLERLRSTTR